MDRCRRAAALGLALAFLAVAARGETGLLGPLRIRDTTPFNLLRLDMPPAQAGTVTPGTLAFEADLSYSNTFVMSPAVRGYLKRRPTTGPLTQADADAIQSLGRDAYYVDGETALLDLTLHYGVTPRTSISLTLPAYELGGGFLDHAIEKFHGAFGFDSEGRELAARNQARTVLAIGGLRAAFLEPPVSDGLGDPVLGVRYAVPPLGSSWSLVLEGAAKFALRDERSLLSTGTNDFGLQASLQRQLRNHGLYFSGSLVRTDGRVLGVELGSRWVPTLTAACELGITRHTNLILQLYASQSAIRDTDIAEIKANKYQATLGLRSRRGPAVYGLALTENLINYYNTPDIGLSLTLGWIPVGH